MYLSMTRCISSYWLMLQILNKTKAMRQSSPISYRSVTRCELSLRGELFAVSNNKVGTPVVVRFPSHLTQCGPLYGHPKLTAVLLNIVLTSEQPI